MSLTSYRAAPPRGKCLAAVEWAGLCEESVCVGLVRFSGLAVTYSPTSWDAVPSARRRLTAEFGMGSGVSLALGPPNLESARGRPRALRPAGFRAGTRDCLASVFVTD